MKTQPKLSFKINSDSQDKSYLTIPIGEFAEVKGGIGFPVELQGENTTEIPFFKVSDMELAGNERELLNANNYVSLKSLSENLKCNFFDKPAVVFAKVGAALLLDRKRICRSKFLIDNNMMAVMPNTDICKLEYLYYDLLNKKLSNLSNTGALPSINAYQIKEVVVKLPCIEEQQKTAEFFTALDEKIRCLDDLAKCFSQSMQGVLNKVFTQQISFKDENGNNYSEWTIKKIKDVAPLQRGFDLPTSQLQDGECTVVYSNGQTAKHSAFKCDGCAVVTGRSGTIGKVFYLDNCKYWPHNTTLWVTDFCGNNPKFIYYLFKFVGLERFSTGTGVPTLNRNDVHDYVVKIPSIDEQTKIVEFLDCYNKKLNLLISKKHAFHELKKAFMQRMFV